MILAASSVLLLLSQLASDWVEKKAILLGTAVMAIGAILQASSFSLPQMFVDYYCSLKIFGGQC